MGGTASEAAGKNALIIGLVFFTLAGRGALVASQRTTTTVKPAGIPASIVSNNDRLRDETTDSLFMVTDVTTESLSDPEDQTTVFTEGLITWTGIQKADDSEMDNISPTPHPSTEDPMVAGLADETLDSPVESHDKMMDADAVGLASDVQEDKEMATTDEPGSTTPEAQAYAPSSSLRVCPGVCVANRISEYCEAALDVEQFCKAGLRCCVSADLFIDVDEPPKEFVILKRRKPPQEEDSVPEASELASVTPATTTTTTTTEQPTTELTTLFTRRPRPTTTPPRNILPELRCKGTCVAGFFAFLCDEIDRSGLCPRGGRCCVTQRRKPGSGEPEADKKIPTPPTTTTTTTTTPAPPPECPGSCLPVLVSSFCSQPSVLIEISNCEEGTICCNTHVESEVPPPTPTPQRQPPPPRRPAPPADRPLPPPFNAISSFFSRPSPPPRREDVRPPRPQRPPPPPPTTTTTTTTSTTTTTTTPPPTEAPDLRLECPGTCIQPLLSFTCFGNADMTDLFRCKKSNTQCCSPKSALRDLIRYEDLPNVARNDTVWQPPFEPTYDHSSYGPPGFDPANGPPEYEQPSYGQPDHEQEQPPYVQPPYEYTYVDEGYKVPYEQPPYQPEYEHAGFGVQPYTQPPHEQPGYQSPPHKEPIYEAPFEEPPYQPPPFEEPAYGSPYESKPYEHEQPPYQPFHARRNTSQVVAPEPVPTTRAPVQNKYVCGVKGTHRSGRVVGGEDALPGEWCWQVALINSLNQYLCGGALIGTQWVLTAAHCVTNIVRSGDAIYVRVGDHDLTTKFGSPGAQTLRVATTYIHHNHNSQTLDNDIALLKLSGHAELKEGVCLACLPARGVSQVAGNRCIVTGYGYMGETGPIPLRVREAEVPVVSDSECVRKINAVTEKIFILPASSFCAGGEIGHDACQGDGGGPLVCNVDGYFELSGLVSWGFGCGRLDVPGVYVKVSSFIGWINQIISVNNL